MSDSRNRHEKRIVNAAMKSEKPAPATPSIAEIASGTHSATLFAPCCTFSAAPVSPRNESSLDSRRSSTIDGRSLRKSRTASDEPHEEHEREHRHGDRGAEHRDGRSQAA